MKHLLLLLGYFLNHSAANIQNGCGISTSTIVNNLKKAKLNFAFFKYFLI